MPQFFCLIAARLDGGEGDGSGDGRRGGAVARAAAWGKRGRLRRGGADGPPLWLRRRLCRRPAAVAARTPVPATLIKCFVRWLSAAGFILCGSFLPQIYFLR